MGSHEQSDVESDINEILIEVAKSQNIKNFELKPNLTVQVGDGFVGQFYTADVVDKDSGETINVAIKKAPKMMDFDLNSIFKNEAIFYASIFPALNSLQQESNLAEPFNNVPQLYCYGLEKRNEYIAMENLKTQGFVLFDKKAYLNKEHLEFIFKLYGKFHALSFVLRKQNLDRYQKIHEGFTDIFSMLLETLGKQMEDCLAAAVDALDPASEVYEVAKDFPKIINDIFLRESTYTGDYRCSTHGDCWSNNMLFKYSDSGKLEDLKLIDFQLACDGTPIHDLSYFFYSGASKSEIDALEYYLKIYHKSFSEVVRQLGEDPEELFSYDTLIKEWKENAFLGIIMGIYLWQIKLLPKEEYLGALTGPGNDVMESRFDFIKKLMTKTFKSDEYRERTSALLIHAYEFGVLRKDKMIEKVENVSVPGKVLTTEL